MPHREGGLRFPEFIYLECLNGGLRRTRSTVIRMAMFSLAIQLRVVHLAIIHGAGHSAEEIQGNYGERGLGDKEDSQELV